MGLMNIIKPGEVPAHIGSDNPYSDYSLDDLIKELDKQWKNSDFTIQKKADLAQKIADRLTESVNMPNSPHVSMFTEIEGSCGSFRQDLNRIFVNTVSGNQNRFEFLDSVVHEVEHAITKFLIETNQQFPSVIRTLLIANDAHHYTGQAERYKYSLQTDEMISNDLASSFVMENCQYTEKNISELKEYIEGRIWHFESLEKDFQKNVKLEEFLQTEIFQLNAARSNQSITEEEYQKAVEVLKNGNPYYNLGESIKEQWIAIEEKLELIAEQAAMQTEQEIYVEENVETTQEIQVEESVEVEQQVYVEESVEVEQTVHVETQTEVHVEIPEQIEVQQQEEQSREYA